MPHISIARLWFEGNSFTPGATPRSGFGSREWGSGPGRPARSAGTATQRGAPVDRGPTCVLRVGAPRVICTTLKDSAADPRFCTVRGIDLAATRPLANKGKNHVRAAFGDRCVAIVVCDAPGPAAPDLPALPWRHVRRAWL